MVEVTERIQLVMPHLDLNFERFVFTHDATVCAATPYTRRKVSKGALLPFFGSRDPLLFTVEEAFGDGVCLASSTAVGVEELTGIVFCRVAEQAGDGGQFPARAG